MLFVYMDTKVRNFATSFIFFKMARQFNEINNCGIDITDPIIIVKPKIMSRIKLY